MGRHHDFDPLHPPDRLDPLTAHLVYADALADHGARVARLCRSAAASLGVRAKQLQEGLEGELDHANGMTSSAQELKEYAALIERDAASADTAADQSLRDRTSDQLGLYRQIGAGLSRGAHQEDLLEMVLRGAQNILGLQRVLLLRVDREQGRLISWMTAGTGADDLARRLNVQLDPDHGALATCALRRRSFHFAGVESQRDSKLAGVELLRVSRAQSFAVAPVLGNHGVCGVLYGDLGPSGTLLPADVARDLGGLAVQAGMVVSSATPRELVSG